MKIKICLIAAVVSLLCAANAAAISQDRGVSAPVGSENSASGLGLQVCGWVRVRAYGHRGTVGAARCGYRAAVCVTDETGECSAEIYHAGRAMGNDLPYCWVGSTASGAGFAECQWEDETPAPEPQ